MVKEANFTGILSNEQKFNPGMTFLCHLLIWLMQINKFPFPFLDFYDWNRVRVRYCDGASFTGDVEAVNPVG